MMMEGAGFDAIDLGINNPVENYLDALEEHKPDILGRRRYAPRCMKTVIEAMKEKD